MIRRYLFGYDEFQCIANQCPDTCCGPWEIEIDEESLSMYKNLSKGKDTLAFMIGEKVDFVEKSFKHHENGNCAFLEESGLCILQKEKGVEYLCNTCDQYPRHIEEFPGVREYSVSVSCPIASSNLLKRKASLGYKELTDREEEEVYEDFDSELYDFLVEMRALLLEVITNRTLSFDERALRILTALSYAQDEVDFSTSYKDILRNIKEILGKNSNDSIYDEKKGYICESAFRILYDLEPLSEEFLKEKKKVEKFLFSDGIDLLVHKHQDFKEKYPQYEIWCENIAYYFLFSYMCGAVYDDYVFAEAAQAIYNTYMIVLLCMGAERENGSGGESDFSKILYQYSRELENCNENIIMLLQKLDERRNNQE